MELETAPREMEAAAEPITAHLSLDAESERLTVVEFGSVWDGQPAEQILQLEGDERLQLLLRSAEGPPIGFMVHEPHRFDPYALGGPEAWRQPRFNVPLLGLSDSSMDEIVLAVQGRYGERESTLDAIWFHRAIAAAHEESDLEAALCFWRRALEAGDMKAHFGLGYTLHDLGRHYEAYGHLRAYTELTPRNSWAWCWLGVACEGLGDTDEAAACYRRAIELEETGGFETDAPALLEELLR